MFISQDNCSVWRQLTDQNEKTLREISINSKKRITKEQFSSSHLSNQIKLTDCQLRIVMLEKIKFIDVSFHGTLMHLSQI